MDDPTYRWTNMVKLFYTTYISVDLTNHEIVRAKVGKGGIIDIICCFKGREMLYLYFASF